MRAERRLPHPPGGQPGRRQAPQPRQPPAPAGLRLRRDPGLSSARGGTVLLGGFPYRLMRISPAAAAMVEAWWQGEPVPGKLAARVLARRLLDAGMAHPAPAVPAPAAPGPAVHRPADTASAAPLPAAPGPAEGTQAVPQPADTASAAPLPAAPGPAVHRPADTASAAPLPAAPGPAEGTRAVPQPDVPGSAVAGSAGGGLDGLGPAGVLGGCHPGDVTVVVPVRDRAAELARCLAGIGDLPVIVVDDCSADSAAVAAAAATAGARYLRRARRGGPAAARNTGLAAAGSPLVAFLDSDCVPRPGWLGPMLPYFCDPGVGAVAPRIVAHEQAGGWLARYEGMSSALDLGPQESIVRPGARVPYVPGAALVVRRAAAGDGFAEDMPVGEDVDFVWRLGAAGWHVRYAPAATVGHQHRVRLGTWFARRMDYGTSAAPLELRHPGTVPAATMSGWSAAAWLAAVTGHPVAGTAITAAATGLLARRLAPFADDPWPLAARLAGAGTVAAGRLLGSALTRTWWPVALPAALAFPRLRLPLAALALTPPVLDWRERRPALDPVRYVAARVLDDVAYSIGVWRGCLRQRTTRPLRPRLWWWSKPAELGGPRPQTAQARHAAPRAAAPRPRRAPRPRALGLNPPAARD